MNDILFSIIIPMYNREHLITRTIQSFVDQTYPHFELIIVDDGGSDNTGEVVAAINDQRIKYFWKENTLQRHRS
jgi:glycosyltransferase involved in cell wall biosynthesis